MSNPNKRDIRIGETRVMNNGQAATITEYRSNKDIDVTFDDGTVVQHRQYVDFKNGQVDNDKNPGRTAASIRRRSEKAKVLVGRTKMMNNGLSATIIAYRSPYDIDVSFEDGCIRQHRLMSEFERGNITSSISQSPGHKKNGEKRRRKNEDERVGEMNTMNCGIRAMITAYRTSADIDVTFENGAVKQHVQYRAFRDGKILPPELAPNRTKTYAKRRIGRRRKMHNGMSAKIIAYRSAHDMDIVFDDGLIVEHVSYPHFVSGHVGHVIPN